jgi:integrase
MTHRKKARGRPRKAKPPWPFPDLVTMTAHPSGQWCKKIKGRLYYFGPLDEAEAALMKYQQQRQALEGGNIPHGVQKRSGRADVKMICQTFILRTAAKVKAGETTARTLNRYKKITEAVIDQLGANTLARDLGPSHFARFREFMGAEYAPATVQQMVTIVRKVFSHAWDVELISDQVRFGADFNPPTGASIRKSQQRSAGRDTFTADEIRNLMLANETKIMKSHRPQLRAMILLGINCGYGLTDCAMLRNDQIKVGGAIAPHLNMPRVKTQVKRWCPLWPETIQAMEEVGDIYANNKDSFFTAEDGRSWMTLTESKDGSGQTRYKHHDRISRRFRFLKTQLIKAKLLPIDTPGFYKLRHTFRTVADECSDENAIARIMGWSLVGMKETYVHQVNMDRLTTVTEHVRAWLL